MIFGSKWKSHILSLLVGVLAIVFGTIVSAHFLKQAYAQAPDPDSVAAPAGGAVSPNTQDAAAGGLSTNQAPPPLPPPIPSKAPVPAASNAPIPSPSSAASANVPIVNAIPTPQSTATLSTKNDGSVKGGTQVKGLSEVSFLEPYAFDIREGRRNPFHPPMLFDESKGTAMLPGTPLERFELEEIKLVGIMWEIKAPKAMFIDPQGEVHVLSKDDRIGRKHGYIAAIREGEVVVVEPNSFAGEGAFSTRILQLEKEKKGK